MFGRVTATLLVRLELGPKRRRTRVVVRERLSDVLVHRPDMPLYDDSSKIGFGLWNYLVFAFVLELAVLFGGMYLYLKRTQSASPVKVSRSSLEVSGG